MIEWQLKNQSGRQFSSLSVKGLTSSQRGKKSQRSRKSFSCFNTSYRYFCDASNCKLRLECNVFSQRLGLIKDP